jgi:hypothetical protein
MKATTVLVCGLVSIAASAHAAPGLKLEDIKQIRCESTFSYDEDTPNEKTAAQGVKVFTPGSRKDVKPRAGAFLLAEFADRGVIFAQTFAPSNLSSMNNASSSARLTVVCGRIRPCVALSVRYPQACRALTQYQGVAGDEHEPAALTIETEIEQFVRAVMTTHSVVIQAEGCKPLGAWQARTVPRPSKHDRTRAGECKGAQLVVQPQPQMRVGRLRFDRRLIRLDLNRSLGTNRKLGDRAGYTGHPCTLPIGERAGDPAFELVASPWQEPRPDCQSVEPRREFVPNGEPPCVVQPDPARDLIARASAAQTPSHGWIERAHSDTW